MNLNNKLTDTSPKVYARIGGIFYLIIIITGFFGEAIVRNNIVVSADAVTTAQNIISSEFLWRLGIIGDLIMHICDVPLMLIFYILLRPVNKNLALLAILFNLVQTAVLVSNKLNLLSALFLLGNADYLKALDPNQLDTLAYLAIKLHGTGFGVGLIDFGCVCLIIGYLIFRSGFLPKTLGVMMQIAGLCYLTNSFALILSPSIANKLFPIVMLPAFISELSLALWLLIKGVNVAKWKIQAEASKLYLN